MVSVSTYTADGELRSEARFETQAEALLFVASDTLPWDMRLDEAIGVIERLRAGDAVVVNRVTITLGP